MSISSQTGSRTYLRSTSEETLRDQATRFQAAIQGSPIILSLQDRNLRYTWVHNPIDPLGGALLVGRDEHEVHTPEDAARLIAIKQHVMEAGVTDRREVELQTDGISHFYDITVSPLYDPGHAFIIGVSTAAVDITDRKRAEGERERLLREKNALLDSAAHGIFGVGLDGVCIFINRAFADMIGYTREEVLGKRIHDLMHHTRADGTPFPHNECPAYTAMRSGSSIRVEDDIIWRSDGTTIPVEYSSAPIIVDGVIEGCVVTITDNSERKRSVEALRRQAQILDEVHDAVITTDMNGIINYWNDAAAEMFGYSKSEAIGCHISFIYPEEEHEFLRKELIEPLLRQGAHEVESHVRNKDGEDIYLHVSLTLIRDADNNPVGMAGYSMNITPRHRALMELRNARDAAESASQAKDHFLAVLSHELRTPLTPVLVSVEALEGEQELPEHVRALVKMIRRNVELEARLIDDLLDQTRILNGKLRLNMEVVDAHILLNSALDIIRGEIIEKELRLTLRLDAREHHVQADPARLQQVFWNLARNAAKFTKKGGNITIRSFNTLSGKLAVEVEDDGIGIASEVLPKIFDPFEQGSLSINRRFGGLGLGLAISSDLIEMHGGRLMASSPGPDLGSVFSLQLPVIPVATSDDRTTGAAEGGEKLETKVMLVEDHADTARVMKLLLERHGYRVRVAGSLRGALALANLEQFDLIISDIGLPDGSGLDLPRLLGSRETIRGIALSGYGMEDDVRRSLEAGYSCHLTKPVSYRQLQEAIGRLLA